MPDILTNRRLDRRTFLRGAGAAVALPLLDAMTPARAAAAAPAARSVFVYIPNGVSVWSWQILTAGKDYEFSKSLKPLERHRADVTPISGMRHVHGFGANHMCGDTWLTGARVDITRSTPYKNTVSCDQVMAEVVGRHTRLPSLELSLKGGTGSSGDSTTLAFNRDGKPLPAEDSPRQVFERLFVGDPGGADAKRKALRRSASVLDAVLDDARSLKSSLGAADKCRVDEYLNAVRTVEQRVQRLESWLDVPPPQVDPATAANFRRTITKAQAGDYYRAMYDLIVLALRTDMTRVVTYMQGYEQVGLAIPEIGITQTRHELSHHNGEQDTKDRMAKSDEFLVSQFAYFLDQLKAATDGGRPLLDTTMVLFGSGMSAGHGHGNANLPTVFAGGRGLGVKHGRHIDYNLPAIGQYDMAKLEGWCHSPLSDKGRLCNLLLTMQQKMGVPTEAFADSTGPMSELGG